MHRTKHLESAVRDGRAQIDGLNAKVQQQDGEIGELSEGLELVSGTLEARNSRHEAPGRSHLGSLLLATKWFGRECQRWKAC